MSEPIKPEVGKWYWIRRWEEDFEAEPFMLQCVGSGPMESIYEDEEGTPVYFPNEYAVATAAPRTWLGWIKSFWGGA